MTAHSREGVAQALRERCAGIAQALLVGEAVVAVLDEQHAFDKQLLECGGTQSLEVESVRRNRAYAPDKTSQLTASPALANDHLRPDRSSRRPPSARICIQGNAFCDHPAGQQPCDPIHALSVPRRQGRAQHRASSVSPGQFGALSTAPNSVGEGFLGFAGAADSSLRRVHIIPFAAAYDRSGMQPALAINGLNRGSGVPVSHGDAEAALSSRNHTSSPTDVSVVQTLSCLTSGSPSATHGWLDQLLCDVRNPRVLEIRGRNW